MNTILKKINDSALKFLSSLTPEETYKVIVNEAVRLTGGRYGSILLESDRELKRIYTSLPNKKHFAPRKKGDSYEVYKTNKSKIFEVKDVIEHHPELAFALGSSDIMVPLSYQNKAIGVLTVLSKQNKRFTKVDLEALNVFAPFATLAIKKTQYYSEMEQALETRDLFISMASHELKTPITTINVYTQLIKRKLLGNQQLETKWIDPLLNEVTRLTKLINELLQVNQIKTGELQYEWKECSLKEIIGRAVNDFTITHKEVVIKFNNHLNEGKDTIWGDYDKILQVIINILNNAVKFSPKYSEIIISARQTTLNTIIEIQDHGKGISKKDLRYIFDRFYRGEKNKHEGMGLGLYLTKKIIDMHNGEISVASTLNVGSTFKLTFPIYNI